MRSKEPELTEHRALIEASLTNRVPFFWTGPGALLISGAGAQTVLHEVAANGYEVLGLDGFEIEGAAIRPRLDLIFDAERRPGISAETVLAEWPRDVWIDFTLRALPADPAR